MDNPFKPYFSIQNNQMNLYERVHLINIRKTDLKSQYFGNFYKKIYIYQMLVFHYQGRVYTHF